MQTSWQGIFDIDPDDSVQVRAGDLQEFLRQQMMGVTNPKLVITTENEHEETHSAEADRALQRMRRSAGFRSSADFADAAGLPRAEYRSYESGGSIPPDAIEAITRTLEASGVQADAWLTENQVRIPIQLAGDARDETFLTIRWMRDDVLDAINKVSGTNLERNEGHTGEVEQIIDKAIDAAKKSLQDRSIEEGWEILDDLIPVDVIEMAQNAEHGSLLYSKSALRAAVIAELENGGWKVRGNEKGDILSLTYRSPTTDRNFLVLLNMQGKDLSSPRDWVEAAKHLTEDESVLWSGGIRREESGFVYADIRNFKDTMRSRIPSIVEKAVKSVEPENYDGKLVRNWYMRAYPADELGVGIDPSLTFEDALGAVSRGGGFYDVLGVGDSVVRERIFEELANRAGCTYDDIYEAWLEQRPVPGTGLLEPVYGPGIYNELGDANKDRASADSPAPVTVEYTSSYGQTYKLALYADRYAYGNGLYLAALDISDPDSDDYLEPFCDVTVNITTDPAASSWCAKDGHVVIDTNNNSKELVDALINSGIITLSNNSCQSGFCTYPLAEVPKSVLSALSSREETCQQLLDLAGRNELSDVSLKEAADSSRAAAGALSQKEVDGIGALGRQQSTDKIR